MSIINQPITKYRYEGIGETGAAGLVAALSLNPKTAIFVKGYAGKIVFTVAKYMFMGLASIGLVVLNVGVAKIETIVDQGGFDGSWESAQKIINKIKSEGRELTDAEKTAIDAPVKDALRKFGRLGRLRKR